jgi:hypothetical protein
MLLVPIRTMATTKALAGSTHTPGTTAIEVMEADLTALLATITHSMADIVATLEVDTVVAVFTWVAADLPSDVPSIPAVAP